MPLEERGKARVQKQAEILENDTGKRRREKSDSEELIAVRSRSQVERERIEMEAAVGAGAKEERRGSEEAWEEAESR